VATRTDFIVRFSDGRLLADRQKASSGEIGMNEHAHSVRSSQTRFLNFGKLGDVGQHLGRRIGIRQSFAGENRQKSYRISVYFPLLFYSVLSYRFIRHATRFST